MVATIALGPGGPKVSRTLGSHTFTFASTSELRDALLASFAEAPHFAGEPLIGVGREQTAIAWAWLGDLVRSRSDWQEAAGIALQHAVASGPDIARVAFADLLANDRGLIVLAPWTAPLVAKWPTATATRSFTGFGRQAPSLTVSAISADQIAFEQAARSPSREVILTDWHGPWQPRVVALPDAAALEALLGETAAVGRNCPSEWGDGPWGWLYEEVAFRPWVRAELAQVLPKVVVAAADQEQAARSLLDWLTAGWDLWRVQALLEGWQRSPPSWAGEPARKIAAGWQRPVRAALWSGVKTLGDVISQLAKNAEAQRQSPPWIDLSALP